MINRAHSWVLKQWDPDGYVYDDPRLQYLDKHLHNFIKENFNHEGRKIDFMDKLVDIGLFILKEDIFYRPRIFNMSNQMPYFLLTLQEQSNIDTFRNDPGDSKTEQEKIL